MIFQVTATETMVPSATSEALTYTIEVLQTTVGGNAAPTFGMDSYTFTSTENVMNEDLIGTLSVQDSDGNIQIAIENL